MSLSTSQNGGDFQYQRGQSVDFADKEISRLVKNSVKQENSGPINFNKEKRFRHFEKRTDNAYINQLHLDQDIFNGLLPELNKNLSKQ